MTERIAVPLAERGRVGVLGVDGDPLVRELQAVELVENAPGRSLLRAPPLS